MPQTRFHQTQALIKHAQQHILAPITRLGYEAYIVGGTVRNLLLNKPINDVDVATNCPNAELEQHFTLISDISKNMAINVVLIKSGNTRYEVAQFRGAPHTDFAAGSAIKASFQNDAARRDFTCNALGIDKDGKILDPCNGKKDLQHRILRATGCPYKRFEEDALRILRGVRLAVTYGFTLEAKTRQAMMDYAKRLALMAPERIQAELERMASQGGPLFATYIAMLHSLGLLAVILPEVAVLDTCEHSPDTHPEGNVLIHTLAALRISSSTDPAVNLALLFHDVGKATTHAVHKEKHTYRGHDQAGLACIRNIAIRLKWSTSLRQAVLFVCAEHMRFWAIPVMSPYKVLLLLQSPYFPILSHVAYCDDACRLHASQPEHWQKVQTVIARIQSSFLCSDSLLNSITGKHIMTLTGLPPGSEVGIILNKTKEWVVNNNVTVLEAVDAKIKQLARSIPKD